MSDINTDFDILKTKLDYEVWRDFYKHGIMSIQNLPEPKISVVERELDNTSYIKLMTKIQLLVTLEKIEPKEVGRLVSMLDSPDPESWTLAEGAIKQKLSEL